VIRLEAEKAAQVIWIDLVLKEMIVVIAADLRQQAGERRFPVGCAELVAPPARAKADVVVELVSPVEFCERFLQHRGKIAA
jgi:hypothetical protein